jgi:hypothetical protein
MVALCVCVGMQVGVEEGEDCAIDLTMALELANESAAWLAKEHGPNGFTGSGGTKTVGRISALGKGITVMPMPRDIKGIMCLST